MNNHRHFTTFGDLQEARRATRWRLACYDILLLVAEWYTHLFKVGYRSLYGSKLTCTLCTENLPDGNNPIYVLSCQLLNSGILFGLIEMPFDSMQWHRNGARILARTTLPLKWSTRLSLICWRRICPITERDEELSAWNADPKRVLS